MRYAITPEIVSFISHQVPDARGYQAELCRQFDLDQSHLNIILGGKRKFVQDEIWAKLCAAFPGLEGLSNPIRRQSTKRRNVSIGNNSSFNIISSPNAIAINTTEKFRSEVIAALISLADKDGNLKLIQALKVIQELEVK